MEEEKLYVYEVQKRAYGRGEYRIRRIAKKVKCLDCGVEWLMRNDRRSPSYCKECSVKGSRNPRFGKEGHNKGKINFDDKAYKRNYYNQKRWERKKEFVRMFGNECSLCKKKNLPICVWQFHHLKKDKKVMAISTLLTGGTKKVFEEISKCVMLCANCHCIIHRGDETLE